MKPKWCLKAEKSISSKQLAKLKQDWSHLLGLCDLGVELEITKQKWDGCCKPGINERHWIIEARIERVLVHELLELLFILVNEGIKTRNQVIFQITNALLRLKYSGRNSIGG